MRYEVSMTNIQVLHVVLKRSIAGMSQKELVFYSRVLARVHSGIILVN